MTIEQARQPSLEEFKRGAREQFSFLVSFGFHEVAPLVEQYQNPYEVHFEKDGWRIVIVGIAYGFSAAIDIRAPDGRSASFWHLVSDSSFRTHREEFSRGQIGDLGY